MIIYPKSLNFSHMTWSGIAEKGKRWIWKEIMWISLLSWKSKGVVPNFRWMKATAAANVRWWLEMNPRPHQVVTGAGHAKAVLSFYAAKVITTSSSIGHVNSSSLRQPRNIWERCAGQKPRHIKYSTIYFFIKKCSCIWEHLPLPAPLWVQGTFLYPVSHQDPPGIRPPLEGRNFIYGQEFYENPSKNCKILAKSHHCLFCLFIRWLKYCIPVSHL